MAIDQGRQQHGGAMLYLKGGMAPQFCVSTDRQYPAIIGENRAVHNYLRPMPIRSHRDYIWRPMQITAGVVHADISTRV
jgi:hypothetical protein